MIKHFNIKLYFLKIINIQKIIIHTITIVNIIYYQRTHCKKEILIFFKKTL